MNSHQLRPYLLSQQTTHKIEDFDKIIPHEKIMIHSKEVYLFNHTIDTCNHTFIEDSIVITQQPFDSPIPFHMHEFIEIIYVFQGKCKVMLHDHFVALTEGELVLIDKETPHAVEKTTQEDIVLNITLKKDYLSPGFLSRLSSQSIISSFLVNSLMENRQNNRFLVFNSGKNRKIVEVINNIVCEYFDKRIYFDEIINSYLIILFSELIREDEIKQKYITNNDTKNYTLIDFLQYIENHYRNCTLTQMANHFNFHPNYLSNLLKKGTGKSFKDLLQLQKMSKAAMILVNSDLPIPDIVEEVGYSSVTFFYKKFKEIFNITPSDYRKENKKISIK
ncbi:AraC family transcriptional regulator [Bacillus sp. WMMC1349]|uniref:AraC family transcriptional regulator n=1 Tax=Bacillus sp. WMMC1349 TaxID=2736254 RepID=UPI001553FB17|nr:helix-turn-helix domain-containing protein [Bacillus sp. WMMC1349]NPC91947.1 AraC family transcriptional regulator [Bacillus sp. WMMC1349]